MARKFWTERQITYLENNWGEKSINEIAEYLRRTPDAVATKAYKIGLSSMSNSVPGIPMKMLGEYVGKDYSTVRGTWVRAGLKTYKCGKGITYVKEKDLFEFMQQHTNLWDARECDYYYFYQEKWFLKLLENERNGIHTKRYHKWTDQEKARFIYMREQKAMYFREIAEVFGISAKNANKLYVAWKKQMKNSKV